MRKIIVLLLIFAVAASLATAAVASAKSSQTRPFKGQIETFFPPPPENWFGTVIASHIGKGQLEGNLIAGPPRAATEDELSDFAGMDCVEGTEQTLDAPAGFENFVAANGDEIHKILVPGSKNWRLCTNSEGLSPSFTTHEIVGGTGRFLGATGEVTNVGTLTFLEIAPGVVVPISFKAEFTGHIKY
jgi:hypothetical protein